MADIVLTIDPDDTAFALHDRANGRRLMGFDAPVPETDSQWAYSADTEGERRANLRYRNRTITADVLLDRSTAALLEALENTLGQKIGKLAREGGELRFTYPTGTTITFNVLEASFNRTFDIADMAKFRARYEITFLCEPFGLGAEEDLGDNTETTLPCLVFTEATVDGDVPALGRLVIDEDQAVDQWWLTWGIQSRYYSSSANAALFYEAEGRTALGGSATAAGPTGASGGGSNVVRNTSLLTAYQGLVSTQATGGGAHLSHVGTFRVYARVQIPTTNTGTVTVVLTWTQGDFLNVVTNTSVEISSLREGAWLLVDLGLVTLRQVATGTQRWEGRILAKSTVAGDDIDVDCLFLVPADEGSGVVSAAGTPVPPSSYDARDDFTGTTAGNALNGRAAPTGGTWATSGDATDFLFSDIDFDTGTATTPETLLRSPSSGTNGRYAIVGTTNYTNVEVQLTVEAGGILIGAGQIDRGLIARWTDSSNHLRGSFVQQGSSSVLPFQLVISQNIAGTVTTLATADLGGLVQLNSGTYLLRLLVRSSGETVLSLLTPGGALVADVVGYSAQLATGGTLATGEPGIWDRNTSVSSLTRRYDDFLVSIPPADAALFASQSLEIRHDRVIREDSAGAIWSSAGNYHGDYLYVPPSGAEARTTRVIVKASRLVPELADLGIDDISARLFVTPRYLVVPQA